MRRHKPLTWSEQGAPSASASTSELPLGEVKPGVVVIEAAVSVHSDRGRSHKILHLQIPEMGVGSIMTGEGQSLSQVTGKQDTENRILRRLITL